MIHSICGGAAGWTLPLATQEALLVAQIAKLEERLTEVRRRLSKDRRRKLNRLKIMVGQMVLEAMYERPKDREYVYLQLDRELTRPHDRAVLLSRFPASPVRPSAPRNNSAADQTQL